LPVIAHFFPGSGITVHNYRQVEYRWWVTFVMQAKAALEANNGK